MNEKAHNFDNAVQGAVVASPPGKTRITIMLDNVIIESFKYLAEQEGVGYQTLINRALRESFARKQIDEETLRRVIREEMGRYWTVEPENYDPGRFQQRVKGAMELVFPAPPGRQIQWLSVGGFFAAHRRDRAKQTANEIWSIEITSTSDS